MNEDGTHSNGVGESLTPDTGTTPKEQPRRSGRHEYRGAPLQNVSPGVWIWGRVPFVSFDFVDDVSRHPQQDEGTDVETECLPCCV